jgi:hypothetical protein
MSANVDCQVAVYIDHENIELSCRTKLGSDVEVDWSRVLDIAIEVGRVIVRRAYADWSTYRSNQRELLRLGVDLIHVPSKRGKNAADIRIVIDVMEMLAGEHKDISHILLVSGDGDFTELVHRLRAQGKVVIGLGISGTSAEYLINACDQFIFYDVLVGPPGEEAVTKDTRRKPTTTVFDVSEARQLLRRALQSREGAQVSGGKVKSAMLRLNPAFSERNYGYRSFKDFLAGQGDLVQIETIQPGGHLVVQLIPETDAPPAVQVPEALLDRYLRFLAQQKIRMTPTEHRPTIILQFYDILQSRSGRTLNELKEELHTHFEEKYPDVKSQYVQETVHQLFHTYCFAFDQGGQYPPDVRLWDRQVSLTNGVAGAGELLKKCDLGLLQRIGRRLGSGEEIDREVAARLLYGSVIGQKMLDHVDRLIREQAEVR